MSFLDSWYILSKWWFGNMNNLMASHSNTVILQMIKIIKSLVSVSWRWHQRQQSWIKLSWPATKPNIHTVILHWDYTNLVLIWVTVFSINSLSSFCRNRNKTCGKSGKQSPNIIYCNYLRPKLADVFLQDVPLSLVFNVRPAPWVLAMIMNTIQW